MKKLYPFLSAHILCISLICITSGANYAQDIHDFYFQNLTLPINPVQAGEQTYVSFDQTYFGNSSTLLTSYYQINLSSNSIWGDGDDVVLNQNFFSRLSATVSTEHESRDITIPWKGVIQ